MPAMMSSEAAKNHGSLENWELRRANARDDEQRSCEESRLIRKPETVRRANARDDENHAGYLHVKG